MCVYFHARYDLTWLHTCGLLPEPRWFYLCRCSCSLFSIRWHLALQHILQYIHTCSEKRWKVNEVSHVDPSCCIGILHLRLQFIIALNCWNQPLFSSKVFLKKNGLLLWRQGCGNKNVLVSFLERKECFPLIRLIRITQLLNSLSFVWLEQHWHAPAYM